MNISITKTKSFIPAFNNNRQLPTDEQVTVDYKAPTIQDRQKFLPRPAMKFQFDAAGNASGGEAEVSLDQQAIIRGLLVRVRNLSYTDEDGEHTIQSAAELMAGPAIYAPLVEEIAEKFRKELETQVPEKNS